ncbi:MAG TPA: AI-2E family transporter, partial [Chitinophagaceae bacterium]|nr:AI-2E family transporter [Chitinophagaceae bacterium]
RGWRRTFSCLACVFILLVIFLSMLGIMVGQVSSFAGNLQEFEQRTNELIVSAKAFVEKRFGIPAAEQTNFLQQQTENIGRFLRTYFTGALRSSLQLLAGLIITLVITFLLLFHKEKYYAFFLKLTPGSDATARKQVLDRIGQVAQHYLVGRAISIILLFVLYAIALIVIGIQNALLLAAVAALFNIIPYLGPILAALFPFLVALVTEPGYQPAIWVLVSFCLFQALDNYWVTPYFLGGEVSLSALTTIVSMICGGFLWGIAGMILFIPILSVVKIVLDHLPGLEHFGKVIGDEGPPPSRNFGAWFKKIFSRH